MSQGFAIRAESFRAFKDSGWINIAPLTVLVGENSAGKTSFLAALNYLGNFQEEGSPSLNRPPFDLGTFKQIANKSGTEHFHLSVSKSISLARGRAFLSMMVQMLSRRNEKSEELDTREVDCQLRLEFSNHHGHAEVSKIVFSTDTSTLEIVLLPHFSSRYTEGGVSVDFEAAAPVGFDDIFKRTTGGVRIQGLAFILNAIITSWFSKENKSSEAVKEATGVPRTFALFGHFLNCLPGKVIAAAPIRSTPQRIYRAANVDEGPDGRDIPYRLRDVKSAGAEKWKKLRQGLNKFGRDAGLFDKFDVGKLTRDEAGPFELRVSVAKNRSSIADVGYGVSQALPLIVDLLESPEAAIFLFQQPEVHLHPRAQAGLGSFLASYVAEHKKSCVVLETHSDYVIDRIRLAVRDGLLNKQDVRIVYFENREGFSCVDPIDLDEEGQVIDPPKGYREFFLREELRLLGVEPSDVCDN